MAHISKEQTVQYILTLIDDTLQVRAEPFSAESGCLYWNLYYWNLYYLYYRNLYYLYYLVFM